MSFEVGITEPDNIGKQKHKTHFENCNQWLYTGYVSNFHILCKKKKNLIYMQVKGRNTQEKELLRDSFFP